MKELTRQQVYEKVRAWFASGMPPAYTPGQGCRYRINVGGRDCKCGIGVIIPDSLYSPQIEGVGVLPLLDGESSVIVPVLADYYDYVDRVEWRRFLIDIQRWHDGSAHNTSSMVLRLDDLDYMVSSDHGLRPVGLPYQ